MGNLLSAISRANLKTSSRTRGPAPDRPMLVD
jgi:hypothetical protein